MTTIGKDDEETTWRHEAACKDLDPDDFFPPAGVDTTPIKDLCRSCPVRLPCLDFALNTNQQHGIWGGLSERERRRIKQLRRKSG